MNRMGCVLLLPSCLAPKSPPVLTGTNLSPRATHTHTHIIIKQTEEGKGRTALYLASGRGHADVVRLLLGRGANPTIKRKGGWCPLSVAASEAHVGVVRILLSHPKVDVDSRCVLRNEREGTALRA